MGSNFSFSKRGTSFKIKKPTNVQTPLKGVLAKILGFRKGGHSIDNRTFHKENLFSMSKNGLFNKTDLSKLSKQKNALPDNNKGVSIVLSKDFPPISQAASMILFLTIPS